MAEQYQEGEVLKGSDGKTYIVVGGVPREQVSAPAIEGGVYRLPTSPQKAAEEARKERGAEIAESAEQRAVGGEQRDITKQITDLQKDYRGYDSYKKYTAAVGLYNAGLNTQPNTAGDLELITYAAKMRDPTTGVLGGEAEQTKKIETYVNQIKAEVAKQFGWEEGGTLTPEGREFLRTNLRNAFENNFRPLYLQDRDYFTQQALAFGIDPVRIVGPDPYDAYKDSIEGYWKPKDTGAGAGTGGQIAPKQAGQLFQTDEDIAAQRQLQDAWNSGASVEQIIQLQQQLGRGAFSTEDIQRMQNARSQNKPEAIQFYASPTGSAGAVEETLGKIAGTAVGGYGIGAYNALTGGFAVPEEVKQYVEATSPVASTLGGITGTTLATIPAGRAIGAIAPTLGAARSMLAGDVLLGAIQGAGESPENRLVGAGLGAGLSLAGGAAANRFLPGGTGTWMGGESQAGRVMAPDMQQGLEAAQQANIPVMTSDVRPPESFFGKSMQQTQERIPLVGTGGQRVSQQQARTAAVQELYSDYGLTNVRNLAPDLADDIINRNQSIKTKYNNQKTEVINRLTGSGVVPVDNAVAELDNQISALARRNTDEANEAIGILQDHRDKLLQGRDLFQVEAFRKDTLAKAFDNESLKPGTRDLGESALRSVYPKLNEDMGNFIKAVGDPQDYTKWRVANKELSKAIDDAKVKSLQNALKNGTATPELVENILFSSRRSDVERLFNNLTPNGQSVARLAILNRVMERAKIDGIEELTPEMFRSKMKDMGDQIDVFFQGAEADRVKGLLTALNLTRRAGEAGVSTNTGQQAFLATLAAALSGGGAALAGPGALVPAALATTLGLSGKIYESKPVRNLLMQISKAQAGPKQDSLVAKLWDVVGKQIPAGAGAVAGAQMAPEAEREGSIQITPGTPAP